jgi:hypothetical protein
VLDNHLTVSIGNPRKQVSNGGINLSVINRLGLGDGLRACICYRAQTVRHIAKACLGLFNNDLPDMMAYSMHLVGKNISIRTFGILKVLG